MSSVKDAAFRAGCVILASGEGRRFGGNKLLAELGGRPLLDYVLCATEGLPFVRRVVVTRREDVRHYCAERGVEVLLHREPEKSDTIRLGTAALAESGCTHALFCMGDQPLVKRESVERLLAAGRGDAEHIFRLAADGVPGAPVLFPAGYFAELGALPKGESGGYVIRAHRAALRTVEAAARELWDVDTQEDLRRIEKMLVEIP